MPSVGEVLVDLGERLLDEVAVAGSDGAKARAPCLEPLELLEVGGHVAVGRTDHDGGALHDVVAGEEHPLLLQQVAQVVRRVAGRVHGAEDELGGLDGVAVGQGPIDLEPVTGVEGEHLGAGALAQARHAGEVIDVGVGAGDPADAVAAAPRDGVEVRRRRRDPGRSRRSRRCRRGRCWCPGPSWARGCWRRCAARADSARWPLPARSASGPRCIRLRQVAVAEDASAGAPAEVRSARPAWPVRGGARDDERARRTVREAGAECRWRLTIVGPIMANSPARWRWSASAGRTHSLAMISPSSWV